MVGDYNRLLLQAQGAKSSKASIPPQLTISHVVNYSVRAFCPPMMVDATPGE